jgi:glycosyltransferase involved in cell wall biosynthesis
MPARALASAGRCGTGFDVLLHAMTRLPGCHLLLAGEGPERAPLEALVRRLGLGGRVTMPGWRSDVGALLSACNLFVCPSRHEPMGNVVLEAWSARRAVVAADAQGPSELIEDGATGRLVPREDAAALAAAIAELVAQPERAAALAAAGRAAFERHHAAGPVLARWHCLLERIAEPRSAS